MSRRWPSAIAERARKQFEMDWAAKEAHVLAGTCSECGGWLDGRTTTAGDGVKTGPCECRNLCDACGGTGVGYEYVEGRAVAESECIPCKGTGRKETPNGTQTSGQLNDLVGGLGARERLIQRRNARGGIQQRGRAPVPGDGARVPDVSESAESRQTLQSDVQGEKIMAETLPMTEAAARPMFVPLQASLGTLQEEFESLKKRVAGNGLTRMLVEETKTLDDNAKLYLKAAEASDARQAIDSAFKIHRYLTGMFKKAIDPAQEIRRWVSSVQARWEMERRQKADAERRQREEEARKEQERQRLEEAAHLEALNHKEEAEALLNSPLPPVALPDPVAPAGKVEGVSVVEVFKFGQVIDYKAFYLWLADNPAYWDYMTPEAGKWKRALTSAKGRLQIPGVTIITDTETRNRG